MSDGPSCASCRHSAVSVATLDDESETPVLECRRYPSQLFVIDNELCQSFPEANHPCGEHSPVFVNLAEHPTEPTAEVPTSEAARQAGVTVSRWHHITTLLEIDWSRQLPGKRGAKLWPTTAIHAVRDHATGRTP